MDDSVATPAGGHNERRLTSGLPVVFILGATATGKSGLALRLATAFDMEIVSCDSRYFYRGMNIGTAKPSPAELRQVPHHLVDILDPEDDYSLATYLDDAFTAIENVAARRDLTVVAGGTPLYLRALMEGWTVPRVPPDAALRAELESLPTETVRSMVAEVDPISAQRIEANNKRRLIRAYEVYHVSGQPLSALEGKHPPPYNMLSIGLCQPREKLYSRIDERVRWMFRNGLLDEARWLAERGVPENSASLSAIGYREAMAVVRGEIDLEQAIEQTCNSTHRYVRHQETWFRRFSDVHWLDSSSPEHVEAAISLVDRFAGDHARETG